MVNETMFCPKCGSGEQLAETFCRQCGTFLPDFDKIKNREVSPEEHLKANLVLTAMTAVVSLTLAILLYSRFLGREDTPFIIYLTGGFLIAMFGWQAQVFWRNLKLKKQIVPRKSARSEVKPAQVESAETQKFLDPANYSNVVEANFDRRTTSRLKTKKSTKSEH